MQLLVYFASHILATWLLSLVPLKITEQNRTKNEANNRNLGVILVNLTLAGPGIREESC